MTKPRTEQSSRTLLGDRAVGTARYSAAREWGMTTQLPAELEMSTLKPKDHIKGVKQYVRQNLSRVDLNSKLIVLPELLRAPDVYVEAGWNVLIERVRSAQEVGDIRVEALKKALPGEWSMQYEATSRTYLTANLIHAKKTTDRSIYVFAASFHARLCVAVS